MENRVTQQPGQRGVLVIPGLNVQPTPNRLEPKYSPPRAYRLDAEIPKKRAKQTIQQQKFIDFKNRVDSIKGWIASHIRHLDRKDLFESVLKRIGIFATPEQKSSFHSLSVFPPNSIRTSSTSILDDLSLAVQSIKQAESEANSFCCILLYWYEKNYPRTDKYHVQLVTTIIKSIRRYKEMKSFSESTESIVSIIRELKAQLRALTPRAVTPSRTPHDPVKPLTKIFNFYIEKAYESRPCSSFEDMHKRLNFLSKAAFLKFCRDFEITELKTRNSLKLPDVYNANSSFQKEMHLENFIAAVHQLALVGSTGPENDRIRAFYSFLGVSEGSSYRNKLSSIPSLIPENLAKSRATKEKLRQWHEQKVKLQQNLPAHLRSARVPRRKEFSRPEGYSSKYSSKSPVTWAKLTQMTPSNLRDNGKALDFQGLLSRRNSGAEPFTVEEGKLKHIGRTIDDRAKYIAGRFLRSERHLKCS